WEERVAPHLNDPELNRVLVLDLNRFTFGRYRQRFLPGMLPHDFETEVWDHDCHRQEPAFWKYVLMGAGHHIANFTLRLAQLVMPEKPWQILHSPEHSTVFDGDRLLLDFTYYALGASAAECFVDANKKQLTIGQYLRTFPPPYFLTELFEEF